MTLMWRHNENLPAPPPPPPIIGVSSTPPPLSAAVIFCSRWKALDGISPLCGTPLNVISSSRDGWRLIRTGPGARVNKLKNFAIRKAVKSPQILPNHGHKHFSGWLFISSFVRSAVTLQKMFKSQIEWNGCTENNRLTDARTGISNCYIHFLWDVITHSYPKQSSS